MILKKPFEGGFCAICTESYERMHDFKAYNVLCCAACLGTPCKNVTMCKKHVEDESSIEEPEELDPVWGTKEIAEPVSVEALTVALGMIMKEDTTNNGAVQGEGV